MKKLLLCSLLFSTFTYSQTYISGRIIDANNFPLPGATITTGSSDEVTITDFDGFFNIYIGQGESITVSYIGFESQTRIVDNTDESILFILAPNVTELSEVIVSGFQGGTVKALNKQRNDLNVTNVVSSDQVGKFPDANIGDALKRIPGIAMQGDGGEARTINMRGFGAEFNSVTLNGERIPSAEGGNRIVQLDLIPSDMIQAIEVNKTLTPDMDADAIGGSVNLVTRSRPQEFRFSANLSKGSSPIREDAMNEQLGVVLANNLGKFSYTVSGSYNRKDYGFDNIEFEWNEEGDQYEINEMDIRIYDVERLRKSLSLNLDYEFNPQHYIYFKSLYNERDDWENRWRLRADDPGDKGENTYRVRKLSKGGIDNDRNKNTRLEAQQSSQYSFGGEHFFGKLGVDWKASYSKASEERPDERYIRFDQKGVDLTFDLTKRKLPKPIFGSGWNDPSKAKIKEAYFENKFTEEDNLTFKIDFSLPYGESNKKKLKFGAKSQTKNKERINDFYEYDIEDQLGVELLSDVPFGNAQPPNFIPGSEYNVGLTPTVQYLASLNMTPGNSEAVPKEYVAANYIAEETISSAYVMSVNPLSDKTTLLFGARLEATDISYTGNSFDEETEQKETKSGSNDFVNILPNITLQTKISENLIINGAFTSSLARPGYYELTPYEKVDSEDREVSVGNPNLEATVSNNLDLMAEYYIGSVGLISAGVFHKNIDNWLYRFTDSNYTWNGLTGFDYEQVRNGKNASVTGLELTFQSKLADKLTLYSNYTFTDSETDGIEGRPNAPLIGAVSNMFNGSLAYEDDKLFVRASLNFSDASADKLGDEKWEDRYYDDQLFIDLNANYSLSPSIKIFAEITNLTNQPLRYYQGVQSRTMQLEYYSYNWNIGVSIDL